MAVLVCAGRSLAVWLKASCDIFFYNTGARLGVDKIAGYAHELTFGELSGIDLDGEKAGIVPSTQWAAEKQHRKWYPSETISVSIGQGPLIVTPLQVANMMASIANGGTVYRPHVVKMIEKMQPNGSVERLQVTSVSRSEAALWGCDFPFGLPVELFPEGAGWDDHFAFLGEWGEEAYACGLECVRRATELFERKHIRRATDGEARAPFDAFHYRMIYQTFYGMRDVIGPLRRTPCARRSGRC